MLGLAPHFNFQHNTDYVLLCAAFNFMLARLLVFWRSSEWRASASMTKFRLGVPVRCDLPSQHQAEFGGEVGAPGAAGATRRSLAGGLFKVCSKATRTTASVAAATTVLMSQQEREWLGMGVVEKREERCSLWVVTKERNNRRDGANKILKMRM